MATNLFSLSVALLERLAGTAEAESFHLDGGLGGFFLLLLRKTSGIIVGHFDKRRREDDHLFVEACHTHLVEFVEHGLGEDSANLLPRVVFLRELDDVEELLELRIFFINSEQAVFQGEVDSRRLRFIEYELAEREQLVMHSHADEMLRDENRAIAQWLVSKHERRRQPAEDHDPPLVVTSFHLEECIDVGGTRREGEIQSALAEFLLNLRENRIRIANDERVAFRFRDIDRDAGSALFVAPVGKSGIRKMLVPLQRLAEGGFHDEIVFLRDIRVNMAGGTGKRQLGFIQKSHDVKNVFPIRPAIRHLARGFVNDTSGFGNVVFESHDAVGVKTEVTFQNEDGLDLALEDVRLAFDGREELEIVREREIAVLAV